jgi:putative sugar O-methyltransferase
VTSPRQASESAERALAEARVSAELPNLEPMLAEMEIAPEIVRPSMFWERLNERNMRQLRETGVESFKQTINRNYFQFLPRDRNSDQFRAMLSHWLRRPTPRVFSSRLRDRSRVVAGLQRPIQRDFSARLPDRSRLDRLLDGISAWAHVRYRAALYRFYVALLWEYVRRRDSLGLLHRLEEPELGRPIWFQYRGRRISEDLCNSVLEVASISEALPRPPERDVVIELGSGYGRLAWVFLEAFPQIRYVLVDIPPALAIAEEYLSRLFPDRTVFRFRHFDRYEDVAPELERAQIAFLTPNQLDLVAPLEARLFLNVSSLHEMRPEQIEHYLSRVGVHCRGYFYSKQWLHSVNRRDGVEIRREDYPIPASWTPVFDRRHPVQTGFFEAMYRLPGVDLREATGDRPTS